MKKHSEIYRAAAKLITEKAPFNSGRRWHCPCCSAIGQNVPFSPVSVDSDQQKVLRPFAQHFKPVKKSQYELWFGPIEIEANRDIRVLALLFMAAIAESEGN